MDDAIVMEQTTAPEGTVTACVKWKFVAFIQVSSMSHLLVVKV